MGVEIDESKYPRVAIRWTGTVTDEELRAVLSSIDRWLAQGQSFALLLDTRGGWPFNTEQRGWVIEHMKANRAATDRFLIQALVIESPLVRALYYAVSWAFPMGFPSKVFSELEPAQAWLEAQLLSRQRESKAPPAA
jgi:hypothetical protein